MKSGNFFKTMFKNMFLASQEAKSNTLEAICTSAVESHLIKGRPFMRVTDLSSVLVWDFDQIREELLQDPRVFPKGESPNILLIDPDMGAE